MNYNFIENSIKRQSVKCVLKKRDIDFTIYQILFFFDFD